MFVEGALPMARAKLVSIADDARLVEAARLLSSGTDILVACDGEGVLRGVVTKTDVVRQIGICEGASCLCPLSGVMTRDVTLCRAADRLADVAALMKERHLKNIPVVDGEGRPLGVLTARAVLRALLNASELEEAQLVDYVKGIGYR
jgi:CBS domain-containing protein